MTLQRTPMWAAYAADFLLSKQLRSGLHLLQHRFLKAHSDSSTRYNPKIIFPRKIKSSYFCAIQCSAHSMLESVGRQKVNLWPVLTAGGDCVNQESRGYNANSTAGSQVTLVRCRGSWTHLYHLPLVKLISLDVISLKVTDPIDNIKWGLTVFYATVNNNHMTQVSLFWISTQKVWKLYS